MPPATCHFLSESQSSPPSLPPVSLHIHCPRLPLFFWSIWPLFGLLPRNYHCPLHSMILCLHAFNTCPHHMLLEQTLCYAAPYEPGSLCCCSVSPPLPCSVWPISDPSQASYFTFIFYSLAIIFSRPCHSCYFVWPSNLIF